MANDCVPSSGVVFRLLLDEFGYRGRNARDPLPTHALYLPPPCHSHHPLRTSSVPFFTRMQSYTRQSLLPLLDS